MKEAAMLDYYFCGLWWAKEATFTSIQTSFTMAVLQMLLDNIRGEEDVQKLSQLHIGGSCRFLSLFVTV